MKRLRSFDPRAVIVLTTMLLAFSAVSQETPQAVRRGYFERITDSAAEGFYFSQWEGADTFRMSADGSKVLFWTRQTGSDTESLTVMNSDGTNRVTVFTGARGTPPDMTECFDISDDGTMVAYILQYAGGMGHAKQVVAFHVPSQQTRMLPTQTSQRNGDTYSNIDLSIQQVGDFFCLSGDGQTAFFINRFGPIGFVAGQDPSGFTLYRIATDGLSPAEPLYSQRDLRSTPGVIDGAVQIIASGGFIDCDSSGGLVTLPVGGFDVHGNPACHLLAVTTSGGPSARVLLDLYWTDGGVPVSFGFSGASLSGGGDKVAFWRWRHPNNAMNGLFVMPTTGSGAAIQLEPGNPVLGQYGQRPRISKDGSAVIYDWPHNWGAIRWAATDGSLVAPIADFVGWMNVDPESAVSEDGTQVLLRMAVWHGIAEAGEPAMDLVRFEWREADDTSFLPNFGPASLAPFVEMVRQPVISTPPFAHEAIFAPVGDHLGSMYHYPYNWRAAHPEGAEGYDVFGIKDNGVYPDEAAGDGAYHDKGIYARMVLADPFYTVRAAITTTDGRAGFIDYLVGVRDLLPSAADFIADRVRGTAPMTVAFSDLSAGDVFRREWYFSAPWPPDLLNPVGPVTYTYPLPGTYGVKLRVDGFGGVSEMVKTAYIVVCESHDVDANGKTDAVDLQITINAVLGRPTGGGEHDVNRDGRTDAIDVQTVINAVLGI